jgi:hypothetical protein
MGSWVAISPKDCIMQYTAIPMIPYAITAPPGPDWPMALPLTKNKPVPIAPPMAIMLSCRDPIPRFSSRVSLGGIAMSVTAVSIPGRFPRLLQ